MATITRQDIASAVRDVARFCGNPGLAHKNDVEGYAISIPYEGTEDHVRWEALWTQHGGVHGLVFCGLPGY